MSEYVPGDVDVIKLVIVKRLTADGELIVNCRSEGDPQYLDIIGLLEFVKPPVCWGFASDE